MEHQLDEGKITQFFLKLKYKGYSKKLKKLIDTVKYKAFTLPGEERESNVVRKVKTMLKNSYTIIKKTEEKFEVDLKKLEKIKDKKIRKSIEKKLENKLKEEIKKSSEKLKSTVRFLKTKKVIGSLEGTTGFRIATLIQSFISLGVLGGVAIMGLLNANTKPSIGKYLIEEQLCEGLKYFKYSKKLKRLVKKLEEKIFHLPGEKKQAKKTQLEEIINTLKDDILVPVEELEKKFAKGRVSRSYATKKIKAIQPKVKEIVKFLKERNVLSSFDWKWLISSALFVPMAASGIVALIKS